MAVLHVGVVRVDREKRRDIGMCCFAMVAFIKIVGKYLPVIASFKFVGMIENVIVKIEAFETLLFVNVLKKLLPRDFWDLLRVQVDIYKAAGVDMCMDGKQSVL